MAKILLVEDDSSVRYNLIELLEAEDFIVKAAENGESALDALKEFTPDLIICDVMMPGMDGHSFLEAVTKHKQLASVPFIFLTAKADPADLRDGMNLGADDYLTKPFTRDQLLHSIFTRLNKSGKVGEKYSEDLEILRTSIASSLPHELRTPLTGIIGFAEYLIDNIDSTDRDETLEFLNYILDSGKRLHRLIENYVTFSELQIKRINTNTPKPRSMAKDVSVLEYLTQVAHNVSNEFERDSDLILMVDDVVIHIAEKEFEKICHELIDNAFRYSAKGDKVRVEAYKKEDWIVLRVEDRGKGFTPEQIASLGAFVQFDRDKQEQQGSGLGLTITRQMVEILGGTVDIDSKPGKGTVVYCKIPQQAM